jgi:hypothetical protein
MTYLLTIVLSTVQYLIANIVTYEFLASTLNLSLFLLAEALDINLDTAFIALPLVTLPLTLMLHAVEQPAARALTAELTPGCHGAGHPLGLLGAEALHWHRDVAGGAGARVAEHVALLVAAVLVLPPLTVLPAGVRQGQR